MAPELNFRNDNNPSSLDFDDKHDRLIKLSPRCSSLLVPDQFTHVDCVRGSHAVEQIHWQIHAAL